MVNNLISLHTHMIIHVFVLLVIVYSCTFAQRNKILFVHIILDKFNFCVDENVSISGLAFWGVWVEQCTPTAHLNILRSVICSTADGPGI